MDITYLHRRHVAETRLAAEATCPRARAAHQDLADLYARQIAKSTISSFPMRAQHQS